MKSLFPLVLLFLTGCASETFLAYTGPQQNWPTSDHAFVGNADGIPIYRGLPPRPYSMVGYLNIYTRSRYMDYSLALAARQHGADAVIIQERSEVIGGSSSFGSAYSQNGFTYGSSVTRGRLYTSLGVQLIRFNDPPHAGPSPPPLNAGGGNRPRQ